ncbi:hypothetical protein N9L86_00725 [Euryarchaeota archaeon]|nr:hypothetical protein [Euryarchaeota archaeon]
MSAKTSNVHSEWTTDVDAVDTDPPTKIIQFQSEKIQPMSNGWTFLEMPTA